MTRPGPGWKHADLGGGGSVGTSPVPTMSYRQAMALVSGYATCARNNHDPCTCGLTLPEGNPKRLPLRELDAAYMIVWGVHQPTPEEKA